MREIMDITFTKSGSDINTGLIEKSVEVEPVVLELGLYENFSSLAKRFQHLPYFVFLDNSADDIKTPYSYITADPFQILKYKTNNVILETKETSINLGPNIFGSMKHILSKYRLNTIPDLPDFQGGAVGYIGYEVGKNIEHVGHLAHDEFKLPDVYLAMYDWVISHNTQSGQTFAVATGFPTGSKNSANAKLKWIEKQISKHYSSSGNGWAPSSIDGSTFTRDQYLKAVSKIRDYISEGDIYQVNLSQRFHAVSKSDPWEIYNRLRKISPTPYGSFLKYPEATLISSSPELYVEKTGNRIRSNPIKGTRPRGETHQSDKLLASELLQSEKERAENLMIVDVVRNDFGRVCHPGSIEVPYLFNIETHPTVFQMVSEVTGSVPNNLDCTELLTRTFPGASVTGAPKIRAMQIIDELEPVERSAYCGGIGYIGFDNSMRMSMAIRIMIALKQNLYIPVGGGIVYDSDPEQEYEETLHKANATFKSLGIN